MRCFMVVSLTGAVLGLPTAATAQAAQDTLPVRVVERMFHAFERGDVAARSTLYDSVYYFQDLMVPLPGNPQRPAAVTAEERARIWGRSRPDSGPSLWRRHREVLQRMVAGRFVVCHIAVVFDPPHEDHTFEKLEIYEVTNGKIVAEYDGQFVAHGPSKRAGEK